MNKFIDIDKIFKDRNPGVYRWIPQFIIRYIQKLVHEDDINKFVNLNADKKGIAYLDASLEYLGGKINYIGEENIPEVEGAIYISNHPLGGLDGLALLKTITNFRKDSHFLVNDLLTNLKNYEDLFIPVNKISGNSKEDSQKIDAIFASNAQTILFPAGLVSRKENGVIKDLEWKKGFISRAVKYNKTIIPVHIEGELSNRFYNLSHWRKKLGLKMNIELVLLPDEMFKQKNKNISITIGKPISPSVINLKQMNFKKWSDVFKEFIYTLKDNRNADFNDFVSKNYTNKQ